MSKKKRISLSVPVIGGNEWKYVKNCLDTGWVSSAGKYVDVFERRICDFTGSKFAVACSNGTAGLHLALRLCGVERGTEVLVPALTFIAPVNAVRYLGAEPVFMDCDEFMNIDPVKIAEFCDRRCVKTKRGLKNKKTGRIVKAVLPVHVFGNPCDMSGIMSAARRYGLKVVEDATESLGSKYVSGPYKGRYTGAIGDFGVYSFNGNKIITTGGGGMIVTNSKKFADKAKYLSTQAKDDAVRYVHNDIGYNYRLTNVQAALGAAQLERLDEFIAVKKRNYAVYARGFKGEKGLSLLSVPEGYSPNYWFYSLIIDPKQFGNDVEGVMSALARENIEARPVWHLNHLQKPYRKNEAYKISRAAYFQKHVLNIPCSANLSAADAGRVIRTIKNSRG